MLFAVVCFLLHYGTEVSSMAYDIGEKPGKGRYACTDCNWTVTLDDSDDRLPPCGRCGKGQKTRYVKVG